MQLKGLEIKKELIVLLPLRSLTYYRIEKLQ